MSNKSKYQKRLNSHIYSIDRTLTVDTTTGQSDPGSNGYERYSTFPKTPELEPHHQRQFDVLYRTSSN